MEKFINYINCLHPRFVAAKAEGLINFDTHRTPKHSLPTIAATPLKNPDYTAPLIAFGIPITLSVMLFIALSSGKLFSSASYKYYEMILLTAVIVCNYLG